MSATMMMTTISGLNTWFFIDYLPSYDSEHGKRCRKPGYRAISAAQEPLSVSSWIRRPSRRRALSQVHALDGNRQPAEVQQPEDAPNEDAGRKEPPRLRLLRREVY